MSVVEFSKLRKELLNEFLNGNLKHTFNPKLVSAEKYVDTFIKTLKE